jgi:hypothetical protein
MIAEWLTLACDFGWNLKTWKGSCLAVFIIGVVVKKNELRLLTVGV